MQDTRVHKTVAEHKVDYCYQLLEKWLLSGHFLAVLYLVCSHSVLRWKLLATELALKFSCQSALASLHVNLKQNVTSCHVTSHHVKGWWNSYLKSVPCIGAVYVSRGWLAILQAAIYPLGSSAIIWFLMPDTIVHKTDTEHKVGYC